MYSNLYVCDEGKVLQRLQRLYPHTDIQKLPRHWNKNDRWMPTTQQGNGNASQTTVLELSSDFLRVTKPKGGTQNSKDAAAVRANRPIPRSCIVFYFEITVVNKGTGGYMGIGLSEKSVSLNRLPGWDQISYGYHGDDGNFFSSSGKGVEYGPTFTTGDVVGCGLNFVTREVFFTKNGKHLGVANTQPISLTNDLYPIVGMQTADEMIDANFGQRPFEFNIFGELEAAVIATKNTIAAIDLPPEKVLWMNSLVANWMAHEGYSRALDALNRTTGEPRAAESTATGVSKGDSQGSSTLSSSSNSKDSQSPTAVAETVANSVMRSMIGLFGDSDGAIGAGTAPATGGGRRRTVVRSVQEALHEEMEQRRAVLRMVKRGQLTDAIKRIEQLYPKLMETNRQLALLLKIQQFIEMLAIVSKELPPLPPSREQLQHPSVSCSSPSQHHHHNAVLTHSPSPRPSSSRGGKRAAVDDRGIMAGTSNDAADGTLHLHNPVKRRSSDEECSVTSADERIARQLSTNRQQNGNSAPQVSALAQMEDDFMDIGEESQDGHQMAPDLLITANGCANGNANLLVGTPPTSTTIIDEPAGEFELGTDGMAIESADEQDESQHGGFASVEEQNQFDRYKSLLEFGHHVSQFACKMDEDDGQGQGGCVPLRQRMNEAFALLCYRDPTQSDHAYFFEQSQRDLVVKALNAAILEMHGREGVSPLDKCLRRARYIRDQALAYSASAVFADPNRLFEGCAGAGLSFSNQQCLSTEESLFVSAMDESNAAATGHVRLHIVVILKATIVHCTLWLVPIGYVLINIV
uniref:Ran-binding protein 9 n=1 Tax=Globodera rostochiensis TaxID=31243 RepID=A0A914HEC0_GLORO